MRTLAKEIVAADSSKLPTGETAVTQENYFRIVSLERLGTEQTTQFQSGDQYGSNWHWGSKCTPTPSNATTISAVTSATCDSSATAANNVLAEMPRSYANNINGADGYGNYYNWYAATAESGRYSMGTGDAEDSLCPDGWQLPAFHETQKSWWNLISNSYDLIKKVDGVATQGSGNQSASIAMKRKPLTLTMLGYLHFSGNHVGGEGHFWGAYAKETNNNIALDSLDFSVKSVYAKDINDKDYGFSVRCLRR